MVEEGILSITSAFLADTSDVIISGGVLNLDFSGTDVIDDLILAGTNAEDGLWGRLGHPTATFTSPLLSGDGLLDVGGAALSALASAVPEPTGLALGLMSLVGLCGVRRRG